MKILRFLLLLLMLAPNAGALSVRIFDGANTLLGYGSSKGNSFDLVLISGHSGPVKLLFSQTEREQNKALFPNLKSSYSGVLRGSVLMLDLDDGNNTLDRLLKRYNLNLNIEFQDAGKSR